MKEAKGPIAVLIGAGGRLPAILEYVQKPDSEAHLVLVVSHKKESKGIDLALQNKIPGIYFNLVKWKKETGKSRKEYMDALGFFVSQYDPKLIILAGWDLVLDQNFTKYFPQTPVINLHPALLTESGTGEVRLPDGTSSPIFKGQLEEILPKILENKLTYYGCTVHEIKPGVYDEGKIVIQHTFKIEPEETIESLEKKLHCCEDKAIVEAIEKRLKGK